MEEKLKPLAKLLQSTKKLGNDSDSGSDNDFIEVEAVKAEHHLLGIDFYPQPQPSTSKEIVKKEIKPKKKLDIEKLAQEQKLQKVVVHTNSEHFWSSGLSTKDEDHVLEIADPSSSVFEVEGMLYILAKLKLSPPFSIGI